MWKSTDIEQRKLAKTLYDSIRLSNLHFIKNNTLFSCVLDAFTQKIYYVSDWIIID